MFDAKQGRNVHGALSFCTATRLPYLSRGLHSKERRDQMHGWFTWKSRTRLESMIGIRCGWMEMNKKKLHTTRSLAEYFPIRDAFVFVYTFRIFIRFIERSHLFREIRIVDNRENFLYQWSNCIVCAFCLINNKK